MSKAESSKGTGAWVPWEQVEKLCQQTLKRSSEWRTLIAILMRVYRYGGNDALISIEELSKATGLSSRTTKSAVAKLIQEGFLTRPKRYRCFNLGNKFVNRSADTAAPQNNSHLPSRGATTVTPPTCNHDCPWPTCIYVSSLYKNKDMVFSNKQIAIVSDMICKSSQMCGYDAGELIISNGSHLLDQANLNYRQAIEIVVAEHDHKLARNIVGLILKLPRRDEVRGKLLES